MLFELVLVFLISFFGTAFLNIVFRFFGKRGYMGNLYQNVRGGTPRAIGIIPFILISLFLPQGFNDLVLIMGICALIDDIIGRRKLGRLPIEIGQLARGIGMLCVVGIGYPIIGPSSILVAFLVQPINISDMQPGTTCNVVIMMSLFTILAILMLGVGSVFEIPAYYTPLVLLVACLGYAPLDYLGKVMLGEVGNHSFAIALGLSFVVPKIYTAIAFDSGGVASGPMTSTFILSFTLGASEACGGNPVTDAFGVIAMVAMTPLITIQILGLVFSIKEKQSDGK